METIRISNGRVELGVVPATGRITEYSLMGGVNMLWNNPRAPEARSPFLGWVNWGGDKVWIWPEGEWKAWRGDEEGNPPGDPAGGFECGIVDGNIVMTSPVIADYGIRIVREISLAAGTRVGIVNRIEKLAAGRERLGIAPWVVTQVPAPGSIFARLAKDAKGRGYEAFAPNAWDDVVEHGRVVELIRPCGPWVKMGLDADRLAVVNEGVLFVASVVGDGGGSYEAFRRAQVFSDPDESEFRPRELGAYVEMEFTGPMKRLEVGEVMELRVEWELRRMEMEEVVGFVGGF